jgi:hypothetical protein
MELTTEERELLRKALDKKLWSLVHVGLPDHDHRVAPYLALRERFKKDVHTEHCCTKHGCKYSDEDCPVESRFKPQSFPCEECQWEAEEESK